MKLCTKCLQEKEEIYFYKDCRRPGSLKARCKLCQKADHKKYYKMYYSRKKDALLIHTAKWRKKNIERLKKYDHEKGRDRAEDVKKINLGKRLKVVEHYSGGTMCCANCGETFFDALTIDHTDNNGAQHRRFVKSPICQHLYSIWDRTGTFPPGYQILCFNCNCMKYFRPLGYTEFSLLKRM